MNPLQHLLLTVPIIPLIWLPILYFSGMATKNLWIFPVVYPILVVMFLTGLVWKLYQRRHPRI